MNLVFPVYGFSDSGTAEPLFTAFTWSDAYWFLMGCQHGGSSVFEKRNAYMGTPSDRPTPIKSRRYL